MDTALLDTCVLWPSLQRDFLLSLAVEGAYRPMWSSAILDELEYEEARKLVRRGADPAMARRRAGRLVHTMRRAFGDAEVHGWEQLEGTYGLPDPDDEHVLAAAVTGGAGVIVTHNIKDFPAERLPACLAVTLPSEFATDLVAAYPAHAIAAVGAIVRRSGQTGRRLTTGEIVDRLARHYRMHEVTELLAPML
ncbi:PIN domain-containing protein [Amycolatopsis suaedae]|uniref:PIN domain-containing protein n=1 Tax=Amycolatopsis suaedae TaxID=2510978 RepID=A0A4Q7J1S2_9PSEU|nr:PIN domain-containing protein [Amycolatopsis suaedae]RZQ60532.1 PIN domain-containing protein [Amycolatopsis suaedae]